MYQFLDSRFAGNSILAWIVAGSIIVLGCAGIRVLSFLLRRRLRRRGAAAAAGWDDFLMQQSGRSLLPVAFALTFYAAVRSLELPPRPERWIHAAFLVVICFWLLRFVTAAVKRLVGNFVKRRSADGGETQSAGLVMILNGLIWVLGAVFLIDNLGYDVTTLVAGLGIGGIAIALAAQTILGDLFSYFVIFFDRPFEVGDFIIVGTDSGIVEHVGIKTTRIRTLSGQQLVCSNTYLTNAQVNNYKRMEKRRVVFSISVAYETPRRQLAAIAENVKSVIQSFGQLEFSRGHLSGFSEPGISFEFVYYVNDPDYTVYMDHQQAIYLRIAELFEQEGIEFARPVRRVLVQEAAAGPVNGSKTVPSGFVNQPVPECS